MFHMVGLPLQTLLLIVILSKRFDSMISNFKTQILTDKIKIKFFILIFELLDLPAFYRIQVRLLMVYRVDGL